MFRKEEPSQIRCMPVTSGKGIPITVLCGFLGSGKTTLLRRWQFDTSLQTAAFIIEDFDDFGIDFALLSTRSSTPNLEQSVHRVADPKINDSQEINSTTLHAALASIADAKPAHSNVFYESTGNARPWPVIATLAQDKRFHLRHFIVTIDALNFHRDFADGLVLLGKASMPPDVALHHVAALVAEQLLFASAIILTKTDSVPEAAVDTQIRVLRTLQPKAIIGLSTLDGLSFSHLDVASVPNIKNLKAQSKQFGLTREHTKANHIVSMSFKDPRPFHPQRLYEVFQSQLGTSLYRTKGILWLASRSDDVLLWQQSGSQIGFEFLDTWAASLTKNSLTTPHDTRGQKQNKHATSHPVFGNRNNTLTLFGLSNACRVFATALQSALCTDQEIIAWQKGASFDDPWPGTERYMT